MVSDGQVADFQRDGFLVLEGFARPEACAAARERAEEIVEAFEPSSHRTVFTTNDQVRVSDELFLSSGDRITCFFEEEALAPDGTLTVPKEQSINKIGHALHDLDPVFERFSYTPELAEVAAGRRVARRPGAAEHVHLQAAQHRGRGGLPPGRHVPLDRPDQRRGVLVRPGGRHARERLPVGRAGRPPGSAAPAVPARAAGGGTEMETLDETPLPVPPDELQPLPVPAGTMIVLDGLLPHWSDANRSPRSRHAYSLHCISAAATYPASNWLQRGTDMPLRPLAGHAAELREGSSA